MPLDRYSAPGGRPDVQIQTCLSSASSNPDRKAERRIFEQTRNLIQPSRFFRFITYIYAERKLVVVMLAHVIATMVVWSHFALRKYSTQIEKVPLVANRYWLKVLAPSVEFGTMHAILFQMALLPLTMSRYSISQLAQTPLNKFVPFNRFLRVHTHLGYTMIGFVTLATVVFLGFFGLLCNDGEQQFCDKFTSEIMLTGYFLIGFLLIVGATSFARHRMQYEVFYIIHHYVFLVYILTTAHTLDKKQRTGEESRSQTFKWFSATLLYYICDRAAMYINNRYRTPMLPNSFVMQASKADGGMILLKLRRPALFQFQPGQYASLKIDDIARHQWHPFSIASGPQSDVLEFYIQVFGPESWTGKLWMLLQEQDAGTRRTLWVDVMGPYGTALADTKEYSHAICIGAGTGIVPMLSLLKQHIRQMMRLDASGYLREMRQVQTRVQRLEVARLPLKRSICAKLCRIICKSSRRDENQHSNLRSRLRNNIVDTAADNDSQKSIRRAVSGVTRGIYGVVFLIIMTIYGISLMGFTYSWCTLGIELHSGMTETTSFFTCLFFALFAMTSTCVWNANHIINFLDIAVSLISIFVCWYWFARNLWANFDSVDMVHYTLLTGYMTVRFWCQTVKARHQSLRREVIQSGITSMEQFELIWVTRSAPLVTEIMPQVNAIYSTLAQAWGHENVSKVLRIKIFVTDPEQRAVKALKRLMRGSHLYDSGCYSFDRPDLARLIENHTLNMICNQDNSHTLLSFCGSPSFAHDVRVFKIKNDITTAITGNKHHQMDYVAESYGGYKRHRKEEQHVADLVQDDTEGPSGDSDDIDDSSFAPWRRLACNANQDDVHLLLSVDDADFEAANFA